MYEWVWSPLLTWVAIRQWLNKEPMTAPCTAGPHQPQRNTKVSTKSIVIPSSESLPHNLESLPHKLHKISCKPCTQKRILPNLALWCIHGRTHFRAPPNTKGSSSCEHRMRGRWKIEDFISLNVQISAKKCSQKRIFSKSRIALHSRMRVFAHVSRGNEKSSYASAERASGENSEVFLPEMCKCLGNKCT